MSTHQRAALEGPRVLEKTMRWQVRAMHRLVRELRRWLKVEGGREWRAEGPERVASTPAIVTEFSPSSQYPAFSELWPGSRPATSPEADHIDFIYSILNLHT